MKKRDLQYVRMDSMTIDDLRSWAELEPQRRPYCESRIAEMLAHPELKTLGEIEEKLHGYDPTTAPETPFGNEPAAP